MRAQKIELSRAQVQQLADHCEKFELKQWFVAKDQGAYVGASAGAEPEKACIFYFKGCDPKKDKEWYDTARAKFGGDDFGEMMDVKSLKDALAEKEMTAIEIKVTTRSISITHIH
jgi:hypothetical protein